MAAAAAPTGSQSTANRRGLPWLPVSLGSLAAVLAVIVLLTFGWGLLSRALPDEDGLAAGAVLTLDSGDSGARIELPGAGWRLSTTGSNPSQAYQLRLGKVDLTMVYVRLADEPTPEEVWAGQRRLADMDGAQLGAPEPIAGRDGARGQTATVRHDDDTGTVSVYLASDRSYSIQLTVLGGPDASSADRATAEQAVRTVSLFGSAK